MRDPDGDMRSRIGIGFDITSEIEARRALEQSERRHRLLIEQIPAATYVRDPDGETLFISPQIECILGYRSRALDGPSPSSGATTSTPRTTIA